MSCVGWDLTWTADWGEERKIPDTQNRLIIFLWAVAVTQVIWTKDNFCFISDSMNSFNCKLKKVITIK